MESNNIDSSSDIESDSIQKYRRTMYRLPCKKKKKVNAFFWLWFYYLYPNKKSYGVLLENTKSQHNSEFTKLVLFSDENDRKFSYDSLFGSFLLHNVVYQRSTVDYLSAIKEKYDSIRYYLINTYVSDIQRSMILYTFGRIQKIYLWLSKRVHAYRFKKAAVAVSTDLCFNELNPSDNHVFCLFQQNKKFYFIVSDLVRMIKNALTQDHDGGFSVNSKNPTNPYNNMCIQKCDLYRLYFHMKYKLQCLVPLFFELWFLEGFHLTNYILKHEVMIRKMCIKNYTLYVSNTNTMVKRDIMSMINEYKHVCKWLIHPFFPDSILVDKLRPYLYIYYLIVYEAIDYGMMDQYETLLEVKLENAFIQYPYFGSKKRLKPIDEIGKLIGFEFKRFQKSHIIMNNNHFSIRNPFPEIQIQENENNTTNITLHTLSTSSSMSISGSESESETNTTVIIPGIDPTNESSTTSTIEVEVEVDNHNDNTNHNDATDADDENSDSETENETIPIPSNRTFNDDYDYNDYDRHFYDSFVAPHVTQSEPTYEPEDFHISCLAFNSWNR